MVHAKLAMCFAWTVSFILWAPWIIGWQFIVSERTVPANDCYIQFIQVSEIHEILEISIIRFENG